MLKFPLYGIERLRITTDGAGVCTLVGACGCPLRCKYCLNPRSWNCTVVHKQVTPEELLEAVRIDGLYMAATGGGVTFGGGEPLVYAEFIRAFRCLAPAEWKINAETCLNIPPELAEIASECIDVFYVDIKDMNPDIYRAYTGCDNQRVKTNLKKLLNAIGAERIVARVPLIEGHNTEADVECSIRELNSMGITHIDSFKYRVAD